MKKALKIALFAILAAAVAIFVYRVAFRKSIPDAPAGEQVAAILEQNGCFDCHSQNPELPFYAKFPVIGKTVQNDAERGFLFTDLKGKVNEDIDEVTLSMLDHSVSYNQMPPVKYKMVHWGTSFNKKEKSVIANWILEKRGSAEPVCVLPAAEITDPAVVSLGERMFTDTRLSLDGTISCADCHVLETGGADHADERVSEGIDGLKGGVNAPTVYNSVFNIRQFWNGRAADLQEQASGPATNPVEMGDQTMEQVVERLSADKALVAEFLSLFPEEGLTPNTLTYAIAEFEKSLLTPDSPFDRYLSGDADAITESQKQGYEAFKKNACATCHTGVILGGKSFEQLCIYGDYFADRDAKLFDGAKIEYNSDDEGLKGFTGDDADLHKFKVPGLRNVALTAPYFHDGTFQTLDEAVVAMARYELGKELSTGDVQAIVDFMTSLTGKNSHLD